MTVIFEPPNDDALGQLHPREATQLLLAQAAQMRASDLFILSEENSVRVAVRRFGQVATIATLARDHGRNLITQIKAEAGMDIGDRRRPHEGRLISTVENRSIDLRINVIPTLHGEDLAARLLDRQFGLRQLEDIGLFRDDLLQLQTALTNPSGLVLVSGPTGSGKTTTLYACLQQLNSESRKINTLEDPVEYAVPGLRQSQVNTKIGLDFSELLRNVLRQSCDVIMLGEIRDEETAHTAVRAANSGTLVLATVHAPVAAAAVQSLLALGVKRYFLANSLLAVISQRLVRTLCTECRVAYDITESPDTFAEVQSLLEPGQGTLLYGPAGCERCFHQGYDGRIGIFELMIVNRALRSLVTDGASAEELQKAAVKQGMLEFRKAALLKIAQGITSMEEMMQEIPMEYLGID